MAYSKLSRVPGMLGAAEGDAKPTASAAVSDIVNSTAFKTASTLASIFHGYRRNDSVLWALAWGAASRVAPLVTPTVAAAQGFGKKKGGWIMSLTNYVGLRSGHPILSWNRRVPVQTRAADAVSLGSLETPTLVLPRPGAPEPINQGYVFDKPGLGCACAAPSMGGVIDTIAGLSMPVKIAGALGAFLLYKKLKKR